MKASGTFHCMCSPRGWKVIHPKNAFFSFNNRPELLGNSISLFELYKLNIVLPHRTSIPHKRQSNNHAFYNSQSDVVLMDHLKLSFTLINSVFYGAKRTFLWFWLPANGARSSADWKDSKPTKQSGEFHS